MNSNPTGVMEKSVIDELDEIKEAQTSPKSNQWRMSNHTGRGSTCGVTLVTTLVSRTHITVWHGGGRGLEDAESKEELEELAEPESKWGLVRGLGGWTLTRQGGVICPKENWRYRPWSIHYKHLGGTMMSRQKSHNRWKWDDRRKIEKKQDSSYK